MELNQDLAAAARELDAGRPGEVGARPQVPRDQPRQLQPRASSPASTVPLTRGPARAGGDRPGLQHVRRPDPGRHPAEPARVRQRPRRPRGGPERGDRPAQAAGRAADTGDEEPGGPEHRSLQLRLLAVGHRGRGRPGGARSRASSSSTSTRPSAPSPASRGRSSRSRSRSRRRPRTPRSRPCRRSGPSSPTPTKLFGELRPGFRAIAPVQKDLGNSIVERRQGPRPLARP